MSKITAADIYNALVERYPTPEWELCYEVGESTGGSKRRLDAIAMNTYPSTGFMIHGIEVKVGKSDLQNELKDCSKSNELARFCTYFYLALPKGILDESITLPPTWGVYELHGDKLRQVKRPTANEDRDFTHGFMAAMLRGRDRLIGREVGEAKREHRDKIIEEYKETHKSSQKYWKEEHEKLEAKLEEVKDATGIDICRWTPTEDIVCDLQTVSNIKQLLWQVQKSKNLVKSLIETIEKIAKCFDLTQEYPEGLQREE
jgi:hypothetical protein